AVSAQNDEDFVGISGGIFAKPGQFPFQAALLIKKESSSTLCGGSIISEVWIITAAHCLDTAKSVQVVVGTENIRKLDNAQKFLVSNTKNIIIHPKYLKTYFNNDVGLLKLDTKIKFSNLVSMIKFPK
uniref:Peptidase S1 domain-containing protein n=1 Tax=Megaselia scalaris TaxID=36166 RepID=T1H527_MEGSC